MSAIDTVVQAVAQPEELPPLVEAMPGLPKLTPFKANPQASIAQAGIALFETEVVVATVASYQSRYEFARSPVAQRRAG